MLLDIFLKQVESIIYLLLDAMMVTHIENERARSGLIYSDGLGMFVLYQTPHFFLHLYQTESLNLSDEKIIEGFLAGRKTEHEILAQWIRELAHIRLHTQRVSTDEIVSDTMYKLLNKFRSDSFRLRESLKAYVQAVAWYTIVDHIRYWRKYSDLPEGEDFDLPDTADISADFENEEDQSIIERVFRLMSEECKELWNLRFVDDFDYKEIGARLGISEGNVKVRFHRCKNQAIAIREKIT